MIAPDGAILFLDVENNDEGIQLDTTLHEENNKIKFGITSNVITIAIWLILFWLIVRHEHRNGGNAFGGHPVW